MIDLTNEQFQSLKSGDAIELPSLMQGLTAEPVVLRYVSAKETDGTKTFTATFFGVTLGYWKAALKSGVVVWQKN